MDKIIYILNKDSHILNISEYKNYIFYDAIEGIKSITYINPFVIFIEINMNKINGLECIHLIRSNPKNHRIKIIGLFKNYNYDKIHKAYISGVDLCCLLPFNIDYIENILIQMSIEYKNIEMERLIGYDIK